MAFQVGPFQTNYQQDGVVATTSVGHASKAKPWKQRWRQELVDALEEVEAEKPVTRATKRAILRAERVLDELPDDSEAIQALHVELDRLEHYRYIPAPRIIALQRTLAEAWRQAIDDDDEDVILLMH